MRTPKFYFWVRASEEFSNNLYATGFLNYKLNSRAEQYIWRLYIQTWAMREVTSHQGNRLQNYGNYHCYPLLILFRRICNYLPLPSRLSGTVGWDGREAMPLVERGLVVYAVRDSKSGTAAVWGRGVSLHLHVYIHLCTYTVYTCILEAYTVYRTGHMLSKQCNEESFLWMARP